MGGVCGCTNKMPPPPGSGVDAHPHAQWMHTHFDFLANRRVFETVWPGSHNAATAAFDLRWRIDHSGLGSIRFTHIDRASLFVLGLQRFVRRWAENQRASVYEQLCAGSRFIDLDVAKVLAPPLPPEDAYFSSHSVACVRVVDVLSEVRAFIERHPREVVLVHLVPHYAGFDAAEFVALVRGAIGDMVYAGTRALEVTLGDMVAAGRRVVLFTDDPRVVEAAEGLVVSASALGGTFIDTSDVNDKRTALLEQLESHSGPDGTYQLSYTLTAQASEIRDDALLRYFLPCAGPFRAPRGNIALARVINPTLSAFMDGLDARLRRKIGVITVDDFVHAQAVEVAIRLNAERAAADGAATAR